MLQQVWPEKEINRLNNLFDYLIDIGQSMLFQWIEGKVQMYIFQNEFFMACAGNMAKTSECNI